MTGLLQQAPPQQAQPEQVKAQQQGQSEGSQEQYDIAAGQLIQWVSSDEGYQAVTESLQAGEPQQAMAKLIGRLLVMMNQSAYLSGKKIPPRVMFQAGMEVARAISAVAQKLGVLDAQSEKEITEDAFFDGVALFGTESASEALTDEDRNRYTQLIDEVEQMAAKANGGQSQPAEAIKQ